jgi:hypothetical protein
VNRLQALREAEMDADDARRAAGNIPEVFRPADAAGQARARWEQAHADIQAALGKPEPEAGW